MPPSASARGQHADAGAAGAAPPRRYRQRLYEAYLTTHIGAEHEISREGFDSLALHFRTHLARHLPPDRGAAVLDLGCGPGWLLHLLRTEGYDDVAGVDASPEQVRVATRLGGGNVVQEDALRYLRRHPERFDVIFAIDFVEHLTKDELLDTLEAAAAALRPGGRFIALTPNADGLFSGRLRYCDLTHELAFTRTSISQALRVAGFARVAVYPVEPSAHGVKSAVRWLLWRAIRRALTAYLAIDTGVAHGHILSHNLVAVADK
jgi:2-polyprenyl-3-methyl-5-hydroxy-6-metoxy-1,4-benzoquinol methylase